MMVIFSRIQAEKLLELLFIKVGIFIDPTVTMYFHDRQYE